MSAIREMIVRIKANFDQSEFGRAMNNIKQSVNSLPNPKIKPTVDLTGFKAAISEMKKSYNDTKASMKGTFSREVGGKFASGVSTGETLVAGAAVAYVVKQAVDLDTAMLGVKKQVSDTVDSMGNYTERGTRIKDMIRDISKESGTAQSSVAGLFEEAGKSGIQSETELKNYAMRILYMKSAFDLTDESIQPFARSMSEYQASAKLSNEETGIFADKLNYLDDQIANVEGSGLLDFMKRTASTFKNAGISQDLELALGATSANAGMAPEVASTALNAVIPKLLTAKETFKKNDPFKAIGMTASQVQAGMVKDADKMVLTIMEKTKGLDKVTKANFLNELAGTEHQSKLATLINNYDVLQDSIKKVNSEQAKNSAQKEYEKRLGSISGELGTLKTNMADIAITAGESLLPTFNSLLQAAIPIIKAIGDWIKNHQELVKNILGGIAMFVAMKGAMMGLMTGVGVLGSLHKVVMILAAPLAALRAAIVGVRAAMVFLAANPMVLVIYALIAAIALLIYNWEDIKMVSALVWEDITNAVSRAVESIKAQFMAIYDTATQVWNGIKSFFGFDGGTVDINANKNVQLLTGNPMANTSQAQMMPQAVTNSYYQQSASSQASVVNNHDNRTMSFNVAPNSSANQAQEIQQHVDNNLRSQNRQSLAIAGSGYR